MTVVGYKMKISSIHVLYIIYVRSVSCALSGSTVKEKWRQLNKYKQHKGVCVRTELQFIAVLLVPM